MSDNHPNTDIDSPEMSVNGNLSDTNRTQITGRVDGSLRDRIAAVIESIRIQRDGDARQMADAVIAALGLTVEAGVIVGCLHE